MLGYEETGLILGMGDRMKRDAAAAQAVVDQVVSQRNDAIRLANHNYLEWEKSQAVVAEQAAYIARLEAIVRRQAGCA
ncbi:MULTISPECIES: hypothetical protein [Methylopilaceae]|uniref:Uncharacterized protein n=2 Tax=Methylopilaceae TaxID=3149309 RepID=A0A4Q0MA70_9HYPH|nr:MULTISPECIES: hypothetical protein [Methylocystaceae]QZO00544.1 hypothetical protein K6K41_02095 [Chenggangzhangella methanolivorans]RXF69985.1 hypothetical protein EK403_17830 [Hansschlegelia zhihuaiae]